PSFRSALAPILRDFLDLTNDAYPEFKYSEWKRINYPQRRALSTRLRGALEKHGAFFSGFYTPVRSFVLERVRTNLMDTADTLPERIDDLLPQAIAELKAEHQGPGQSGMLKHLLLLPAVSAGFVATSFQSRFRIVCDP